MKEDNDGGREGGLEREIEGQRERKKAEREGNIDR